VTQGPDVASPTAPAPVMEMKMEMEPLQKRATALKSVPSRLKKSVSDS